MDLKTLLSNMHFDGQVSVRRRGDDWFEYVFGGSSVKVSRFCGYYTVVSTCIIDGILVIYVE